MTSVRRIALTGGIATGKSQVRAQLAAYGVATIDADALAREVVAPGTPGLEAVVRRFGSDVLNMGGALDRRKLAALVFADPASRRDLEAIVHPAVQQATDSWFDSLDPAAHPFAVAEIPLLYEVGREGAFDAVIVAACKPETQVRRVMARDAVTETEARQRLVAQLPIEDKVRRAVYAVSTDGTIDETNRQLWDLYHRLVEDSR
jgi:dephospho-CoA kinase